MFTVQTQNSAETVQFRVQKAGSLKDSNEFRRDEDIKWTVLKEGRSFHTFLMGGWKRKKQMCGQCICQHFPSFGDYRIWKTLFYENYFLIRPLISTWNIGSLKTYKYYVYIFDHCVHCFFRSLAIIKHTIKVKV